MIKGSLAVTDAGSYMWPVLAAAFGCHVTVLGSNGSGSCFKDDKTATVGAAAAALLGAASRLRAKTIDHRHITAINAAGRRQQQKHW